MPCPCKKFTKRGDNMEMEQLIQMLAEKLAKKINIPFLSEKIEIYLIKMILRGLFEVVEELLNIEIEKDSKKK
jgi:hypothetical protein